MSCFDRATTPFHFLISVFSYKHFFKCCLVPPPRCFEHRIGVCAATDGGTFSFQYAKPQGPSLAIHFPRQETRHKLPPPTGEPGGPDLEVTRRWARAARTAPDRPINLPWSTPPGPLTDPRPSGTAPLLSLPAAGTTAAYTVTDPRGQELAKGAVPINEYGAFHFTVPGPSAIRGREGGQVPRGRRFYALLNPPFFPADFQPPHRRPPRMVSSVGQNPQATKGQRLLRMLANGRMANGVCGAGGGRKGAEGNSAPQHSTALEWH